MDASEIRRRRKAIYRNIRTAGLDGYLVLDRANTLYASGFHCTSSYMLLTWDECYFITDFRYIEAARKSVPESRVILQKDIMKDLAGLIRRLRLKKIGVECSLSYGLALQFRDSFKAVELIASDYPLTNARIRKSKKEIDIIRQSVHLADAAYIDLCGDIEEGWTEVQVRNRLRRLIERHGGDKESFDSIIATGANASRPHAVPGKAALKRGDVLQVDTGLMFGNYCSDLSRIMSVGRPSEKLRKIHQIVVDAQRRAIDAIRPGAKAKDVDAKAREFIAKKGYGKNFGHGTGHGVGLEIHEPPTLRATSTDVLEEGMVVTVEPGIYLPNWGGVRIEDMVVVTNDGCENMTTAPKTIAII